MTPEDFVGTGFGFGAPTSFVRVRPGRMPDPYNPDATVEDPSHPDILPIKGGLSSTSSVEQDGEVRQQAVSTAQLVIDDPFADVKRLDRITTDPDDGRRWTVQGFPANDQNVFTGWRPTLVCDLEEDTG